MGESGSRKRRRPSRREKDRKAKKLRIALVVVAMWLAAVAAVFILVEGLPDSRDLGSWETIGTGQ